MPKAETLLVRVAGSVHRRFGTAPARYRLALSSGFVIASIGMATIVIGQAGQAQDFLGALSNLFAAPQAAAPQVYATGSVVRQARRSPRRASYADYDAPRRHPRARQVAEHQIAEHQVVERQAVERAADSDAPVRLGRASICVRACDGFAFPVGTFHGEGDIAAHEATCRSECPGAQTALYVLPNGSSAIDEAVEARTGHAYSQKASGFHYTTYLDEACSCHPKGGNRISSLLRDFTLRRGDAVVTNTGVKVFHGGGHFPYRQADFVRLAQSRDVKKTALTSFRAIERAGLVSNHPTVAEAARPVPAASLKPLEHQASLEPVARPPATP